MNQTRKHTIATGFAVGLESLVNLEFRPDRPFRCCLICGRVFQTDLDRESPHSEVAHVRRDVWAVSHAKHHTDYEHDQLRASGRFCTPEAAERLAAFGIFSVNDLVMDNEVSDALRLSKPVPQNDAEY